MCYQCQHFKCSDICMCQCHNIQTRGKNYWVNSESMSDIWEDSGADFDMMHGF